MTTTEPTPHWIRSARDRAELDEMKHRLRAANIWARVLANDPDPMAAALGRQFLDYLEPTQAEPVGVTTTEYRVESLNFDGRWGFLANVSDDAETAEEQMADYASQGFIVRLVQRHVTAWTPVHTDDTTPAKTPCTCEGPYPGGIDHHPYCGLEPDDTES